MSAQDQGPFIDDLLAKAPTLAALTPRERALVRYADVVTLRPSSVTPWELRVES